MNILEVIPSVDAASGGPIESSKQFARIACAEGHVVEFVSLDKPDAACVKEMAFRTYGCGPARLGAYGYAPRFLLWMKSNAVRYDAVVVNGIWAYHSWGTWRALRQSNTPYVVFTHGMLDPWFKQRYPAKHMKKWLYWPWAEYRVLRDAAAVLFTCEQEKILARESFWLYRCNEGVINVGTADRGAVDESGSGGLFNRFPELRGKQIALSMGRIHPKKGCDLAIEAFAKVLGDKPNWHLVMAGPDEMGWKSELSAKARELSISDRITWAGMLHGEEKWDALRSAEFLLLPSHQENFGLVVAEALACGLPALVSTKVNIWREICEDGAAIAANDDLDGTCELLRSWVSLGRDERSSMRERARQCFTERFEAGKGTRELLMFLEQTISSFRTRGASPHQVPVTSA